MKKDVGFSVSTFVMCTLVFVSTLIFSGCQNDLLESPSFQTRGSYVTGRVAAPTNVTATQGGFKSITLKWTAAKNATRYEISASDTATGEFTFVDSTQDATCSFTLSAEPDVKKYFKIRSIRAIDSTTDEYSEQYSNICFGTTLATPIITSIKQNAKGDAITVRWYKGVNCTTDTYLNSGLIYTVVLYNADGTQVIKEETISALDVKDATNTKYTFTNLTPNTEYRIQVKAYTKSAQDSKSTESSDIENQSTAHSLIPAAPENFAASKGTSKSEVKLSWTLPKFAEIKSSTAFETRPVYFKIYRKLETAAENAYEPIVTYLGTTETDTPAKTAIHFTKAPDGAEQKFISKVGESLAEKETTDEAGNEIKIPAKVTVNVEYPTEETETDPNYPNYIPGTKITLTDTTVLRGQKYSYRIQSFIDDNGKKNVTSDESYSEDIGWLINSPTISVSSEYKENKDDKDKIDSFTVTLNFKFDDFDQPYNYVVTETCQKMIKATQKEIEDGTHTEDYPDPNSPETKTNKNSTSYKNFFPWTSEYTPLNEDNAYLRYTYDVSVCSKDTQSDNEPYITVSAPGSVIVINDKSMIPDVSSFKVEDGYKDKFKLSWVYDPNCKYILTWNNTDKNGTETQNKYEFQESDFLDDKGNQIETKTPFKYDHLAESGDIRTEYTLHANNGLENSKTAQNEDDEKFKTLGTPEPYFEPSYNTIKVTWQAVQKADSYVATYKFENNEITISSDDIKSEDDGKTFYCEVTKPYGETSQDGATIDRTTDATIAGKDIDFTVTAISKNTTDESEVPEDRKNNTTIPVSTLGPANLGMKISGDRKTITVEWNKVEGANGYLIFRKKYINDYFSDQSNKGDLYYYKPNSENGTLSLIGADATTPSKCVPNTSKTFKFTDIYQALNLSDEKDLNDQYKTDQAQLAWGLPYGYTIIPVKKYSDFEFDDNYEIQGTSSSIAYTELNKVEQKGATYGYGLSIEASKAETNDKVKISWKPPYNTTKTPILLYRRYNEKDCSNWTQDEEYKGTNTDSYTERAPAESCKAYDYLVYYNFDKALEIDPYYEYFLSTRVDSDNEKANKGYILSFETPKAMYAGNDSDTKTDPNYYAEKFTWKTANFDIYDTDERKKKPDSIIIRMLNTNKSIGWTKVAEIDPDTLKATADTANCSTYDLDIDTSVPYNITVAPNGIKNKGATNSDGLLKVLRDAKHYYSILGSRTVGDTTIYAEVGDKGTVSAYRQITDEELVKATMLVIADSMQDAKMDDGKYIFGTNGTKQSEIYGYSNNINSGYFTWSQYVTEFYWYITNYTRGWSTLPYQEFSKITHTNTLKNFITISDINSENKTRGKKISSNYPSFICFDNHKTFEKGSLIPIEITPSGEPFTSLSSYSGKINFKSSDSNFSVTVEHNGSQTFNKDVSGDEVKRWFPAKIGNNEYTGNSSEYGWWED